MHQRGVAAQGAERGGAAQPAGTEGDKGEGWKARGRGRPRRRHAGARQGVRSGGVAKRIRRGERGVWAAVMGA